MCGISGFAHRNHTEPADKGLLKRMTDIIALTDFPDFPDFPDFSSWNAMEQIQYMETKSRLTDLIVSGLDRISMAHSVEARVPFLDHELVEMASQLLSSLQMKRLKEKYILRKPSGGRWQTKIVNLKKTGLAAPGND